MAHTHDLVIRGGIVVGSLSSEALDVAVDGETITALGQALRGRREIDASGLLVLPGVIDAHTHMDLPVRGMRSSDDFESGTIAAAFGGVTTIVDFTVGGPESTIPEDIERRQADAAHALIDYAFHAEVIGWRAGREWEFRDAVGLGVTSFKFYTAYGASGRRTPFEGMKMAFGALAEWSASALVHCEDDGLISSIAERLSPEEIGRMGTLAEARPDICERSAIAQVARLASETGCATHIVHVSSKQGLEAVREGRTAGAPLTAETCPQYLLLTREVYERPNGHLFSASPALRTDEDRHALWQAIRTRDIDFVATDHCPFTSVQKTWKGDFRNLPYGLPGVETLLPLLYSEGVARGVLAVTDLPRLLSEEPARKYGLSPKKGSLVVGADADIVLFDPEATWTLRAEDLHMRTDFSPYQERSIRGRVVATIARGETLVSDGQFRGSPGRGRYLGRSPMSSLQGRLRRVDPSSYHAA